MFLIRTAFWLTLVILLLPTSKDEQRTVYGTAEAAVKDLSSFCVRNPDVCAKSRDAFAVFSEKAQFGASMLVDFVSEARSEHGPETADADSASRLPAGYSRNTQNTLTQQDMEPGWSAPSSNSGI